MDQFPSESTSVVGFLNSLCCNLFSYVVLESVGFDRWEGGLKVKGGIMFAP